MSEKKQCDGKCADKIRGVLVKQYGESVDLELAPTINVETGKTGSDFPPLRFTYLDGKKKKRSFVVFNYCPFCGGKAL